jgi:hypothetical protein
MAEDISFLDVASKRGVVNIAQQGAQALGTLANAVAKQKAKEDKVAKEQLGQIAKMVTPPTKMHKLVKEPAAKNYVAAVSNIYNAYNSGDSNWQTKAMTEFGTYTEDMAAKSALSDNLNAFDKIRRDKNNFIPKNYVTLGSYIDKANNAQQFIDLYEKNPVPGLNIDNLNIEDIPIKKKIPIQSYLNGVFDKIEPVQLGKTNETVIVKTDDEAKKALTKYGVKPNSIESVVVDRFLDDYDFLEQYIDVKGLDMDYMNLGPEEREVLKQELIGDGAQFAMKKFQKEPFKISIDMGKEAEETPFGFSKKVALAKILKNEKGENQIYQSPQFGNIRPNDQAPITFSSFKGTLDRNGKPISTVANKNKKLSGISVMPYKILPGGEEEGIFDVNKIEQATGFQIYYEFEAGDIYLPSKHLPNLQFNVGGKDPVKAQQYALKQLTEYRINLNNYQKKVKSGAIKNPLLYKKLKEYNNGTLDQDEFSTFVENFKFDK